MSAKDPCGQMTLQMNMNANAMNQVTECIQAVLCVSQSSSVTHNSGMTDTIEYRLLSVYSSSFTIAFSKYSDSNR